MVARITSPKAIRKALSYNENKVRQGVAECIHAAGFIKDAEQMNFYEKLHRFEDRISLNQRAKTNALHISLNFDAADQLDKERLIEIAGLYMEKIGFGDQPYLVYQHHDSGHRHVHILTTSIREDGRRIDTYNIGRNQSEKARKEIENVYSLVKPESKKQTWHDQQEALKVQYGKTETKRAISNVLDKVINQYRYTSLAELNAVLLQYNVMADRGQHGSRTYQNGGLVYRVLDDQGKKAGAPVKASDIYNKPTWPLIQSRFEMNGKTRKADAAHARTAIDWVLAGPTDSLAGFARALEKEHMHLVIRRNEDGIVYGLTYIDHTRRNVFNGSDLGKEYSARRVLERLGLSPQLTVAPGQNKSCGNLTPAASATDIRPVTTENAKPAFLPKEDVPQNTPPAATQTASITTGQKEFNENREMNLAGKSLAELIELLVKPEDSFEQVPYELRKEEKQRKKKPGQEHFIER
ncbi:relaxase/mobilization nuclease domain-containing protein [Foetidibacter luteolus]|uniref:relaxase/mobilization nuclease domain-containing protein n=1 Tax=Foetidibacter luteolus TaxID=2608880 RepID=UPI00129B87C6|nr:relaxase/mobilization nuclease domain-containing protein [Foetidibacter luteolus]